MPATGVPADAFARRVTFALRNSDQHRSTLLSWSRNYVYIYTYFKRYIHLSAHLTRSHDAWPVSCFRCWAHHSLGSLDIESLVSWRNTDVSRKVLAFLVVERRWMKEACCIIFYIRAKRHINQPDISSRGSWRQLVCACARWSFILL